MLIADVSEPYISSIFIGRWMKYDKGCGVWLLHQPARTLSGINAPHTPSLVILHPPAYEDGTDRGFRNVGY